MHALQIDHVVRRALEQRQPRGGARDDASVRRPIAIEAADEPREDEDAAEGLSQRQRVSDLRELVIDQLMVGVRWGATGCMSST